MDAAEWDRRYADNPWLWTSEPNLFLATEVGGMPPGRALDLGCGEGRNSVWLAERGWEVTGVDFSRVALRRAQQLSAHRGVELDWVHADVVEWRPPPSSFDLVVMLYLHLPADQRRVVLDGAVEALAEGGVLLVVGHDRDNVAHGYGGPQVPEILYTVDELRRQLSTLRIEKATQVRRAVETEEGVRTAIDTLVRAVREPHPNR